MEPVYAFLDEFGEEGFSDKSSEWFVLAASLQRGVEYRMVHACYEAFKSTHRQPGWHFHFVKQDHRARIAFIEAMRPAQYRFVSVAVHKPSLTKTENFKKPYFLYFYAAKLLLERISWMMERDNERLEGFFLSSRRGLHRTAAKEYLATLRDGHFSELSNRVRWSYINSENVFVLPNKEKIGLQLADCMASSVGHAICPHPYGVTEPRYLLELKDHIYDFRGTRLSYGLKFFPRLSAELKAEPRFSWLDAFGADRKPAGLCQ